MLEGDEAPGELLRRADTALYAAKAAGGTASGVLLPCLVAHDADR